MTRRYPTSIRFGGGFRVDCATASRSVRLTFAGCDHRIGRIQPALNDFWAISSARMSERLRQLGIQSGPSGSTALFQLATDLPAAILARMLGIHISVAVAWQRASSGDWTTYAAEVSRRTVRRGRHSDSWNI
jgi:hypothetical protein